MRWFNNSQIGELICTETTTLHDLRIQTVLDSGFFLNQKERYPKSHNHPSTTALGVLPFVTMLLPRESNY